MLLYLNLPPATDHHFVIEWFLVKWLWIKGNPMLAVAMLFLFLALLLVIMHSLPNKKTEQV